MKILRKRLKVQKEIMVSKRLVLSVVVVLAVVVGIVIILNQNSNQEDVAAIVNGEVITITELNEAFDSLPSEYAGRISKTDLLNQIVQTKVIYQKAEKQGLVMSEEEVRQQFQFAKISSGLTDEQFLAGLEAQGVTEEEFIADYTKQLTLQKFIDENLLSKIKVSDEEINEYYTTNSEQFKTGEQVRVKHILIGNSDMTEKEQNEKAKKLLNIVNKNNFCEYVEEHSTDTASVPTCGEYTFTRDDSFVEEFKKLSFEQKAGDIGTVQTQFGTHIIWTVERIPSKALALGEVKDNIIDYLKIQKGQEQYEDFYEDI